MFINYLGERELTSTREALVDRANTIIAEYRRDGLTLTLRQLYYQHVARGLIENTERSYKNLGKLISDGRMAGLISWDAIEDRGRGVKGWLIEEDESAVLNGIEYGLSLDLWERQGVYVEVWVEKEALAAVVERTARRFRAPYMACKGYLSQSEAWRSGRRFLEKANEGRRCVMIHLGDHDPSGIDMTRDNGDRLELFGDGEAVEVRRIALNMDQIEQYRPPPNPAKETDSRATGYVERFGRTSWELDALDPRTLDRLITSELETLIDADLWETTKAEEQERRAVLKAFDDRFEEIRDYLTENPYGPPDHD